VKKYICPKCGFQTISVDEADKHLEESDHGAMFYSGE